MPSGTVIKPFRCRELRIQYQQGMEYSHDDVARIEYLRDLGYLSFTLEPVEPLEAPAPKKLKKAKG